MSVSGSAAAKDRVQKSFPQGLPFYPLSRFSYLSRPATVALSQQRKLEISRKKEHVALLNDVSFENLHVCKEKIAGPEKEITPTAFTCSGETGSCECFFVTSQGADFHHHVLSLALSL